MCDGPHRKSGVVTSVWMQEPDIDTSGLVAGTLCPSTIRTIEADDRSKRGQLMAGKTSPRKFRKPLKQQSAQILLRTPRAHDHATDSRGRDAILHRDPRHPHDCGRCSPQLVQSLRAPRCASPLPWLTMQSQRTTKRGIHDVQALAGK